MRLRELEVGMEEEILMADADFWRLRTEQEVSQTTKNFVEVDDEVSATVLNVLIDTGCLRYIAES